MGQEYSNSLHFNIANGFRSEVGRNVRYWPLATSAFAPHVSTFGGKADMPACIANVRF
jgi:hypothetical protein